MTTRIRVQQAIEELGYVPDGAAQSLSRRRKDVIGMVCVEREAEPQDIENVGLLYYDEVLRGVEARIRDHNLLLLITFIQAEGIGTPDFRRLDSMSGKVDGILIGEGFVASHYIERLATRVPVVVIAGTPGEQAADVVAADNFSGSAAIITHLIADHGRRRLFHVDGPPDSPDAIQRRLALEYVLRGQPHCELIGSTQGIFSVRSGEQAGEELLARHRALRKRSCVPTTRWRSESCGLSPRPAGPRGGGRGWLRRIFPAACSIPRSAPCTSRALLGERCARISSASPTPLPPVGCCRPSFCGRAAAARPAR